MHIQLIELREGYLEYSEERIIFSTNNVGKLDTRTHKNEMESSFIPHTKINSECITDLNLRPETVKLLEEN